MYIVKHAVRSICRSKGRSILIGVILFVLALCSCIGLGIQKAADSSRTAMEALTSITATIETDRRGMMEVSAVSSVSEASDPIILLQMAGIAFVLVILSSSATLISIFRFDPLIILANRD